MAKISSYQFLLDHLKSQHGDVEVTLDLEGGGVLRDLGYYNQTKACKACGGQYQQYILRDALWCALGNSQSDVMCLDCLEAQLGRCLTSDDFSDAQINSGLLWALARSANGR